MRTILYAAAIVIGASGSLPAFAQSAPAPEPAPADTAAPAEAAPAVPAHHHSSHRHHRHHAAHHHAMAASTGAPDPQKEAQDHLTTPTPK